MNAMTRLALAAIAAATLAAPPAFAVPSDLVAFLERTERMASYPKAVAADISIEHGDSHDRAFVAVNPEAGKLFLAVRSSGWRALMPLDWNDGIAVRDGKRKPWKADQPAPGTDLRPMEFFPFWRSNYGMAFISDENRTEKTITFYTDKVSPYELIVITFDKTRLVPTMVKYYQGAMNTLVRLRRNSDFSMVGSRLRPRSIVFDDFQENRHSKCRLRWRILDEVPADLFSENTFAEATIAWPKASGE